MMTSVLTLSPKVMVGPPIRWPPGSSAGSCVFMVCLLLLWSVAGGPARGGPAVRGHGSGAGLLQEPVRGHLVAQALFLREVQRPRADGRELHPHSCVVGEDGDVVGRGAARRLAEEQLSQLPDVLPGQP